MNIAVQAARLAGASIQQAAQNIASLNIEQKSLHDYVSEVDRCSEKIIVEHILSHYPNHCIIGEEYGQQGKQQSPYEWIIDPLDGTTNFLRSIPHYAVSIGVMLNKQLEHAVVYDPAKDELFTASRGIGAWLNHEAFCPQDSTRPAQILKVREMDSIVGGLLATGVPFSGKNLDNIAAFTGTMEGLLKQQTSGLRRLGAAALDLAYVAAGRYDGFWESNLQAWDIAAGMLLVEEAGGVVSDLQGGNRYFETGDVLAASPSVHSDMLVISTQYY